jgi:hypothetical protein
MTDTKADLRILPRFFWLGRCFDVNHVQPRIAYGAGEIRTHEALSGSPVFKTGAFNHSATAPLLPHGRVFPGSGSKLDDTLRATESAFAASTESPRSRIVAAYPAYTIE